jgi:PAS domain S-box-containing protein
VHGFRGKPPIVSKLALNGPGVIVKAVVEKTSIRISDCREEPAYVAPYPYSDQALTMLSELVVPVIVNGEVVAILHVENTRVDAFSAEDQMLLEILANHVAATLNRIRQEDELRRHSEHLQELVEQRTRKLSESEARFRELADMLPQIVFEVQKDGRIEFLNREGLRSLGYTEQELQKGLNALSMVRSDEVEHAKESVRSVMSRANPEHVKLDAPEFDLVRKDGNTFPALVYSYPIARNSMATGLRGIAIDITERKRIEEELLRARHITAIGETAAMVGHDLRNPLQGAAGAVYLIRDSLKSGRIEEQSKIVELLDILEGTIYYMDKIVRDLQTYAAPVRVIAVKTDLRALIEETLSNVRLPENVETNILAQEDLSNIEIDPLLLRHVLTNLTINGVQAMPEGGKLTVECSKIAEGLVLSVRDTGTGIAPEDRNKLFMPFFTTKAQGQGLGLAVCKRLVEAQGGTINVESELGSGSTFTVIIPRAPTRQES